MAIESTYEWREQSSSSTIDSQGKKVWTCKRGWLVTGLGPGDDPLSATPLDGVSMPAVNDAHPLRSISLCRGFEFRAGKGPRSQMVIANYDVPPLGSWSDNDNPLLQPLQISDAFQLQDYEMELDNGDPQVHVLNSAGLPFAAGSGPTRPQDDPGWVFARYEPIYPLGPILTLSQTTNDNPVALPGIGTISAGQGYMARIRVDPFNLNAEYVRVLYTILCRADGWRTHTRDSGEIGWGDPGESKPIERGRFINSYGDYNGDTLLDGSGKPIDTKIKVRLGSGGTADPAPNTDYATPSDYLDQPDGSGGPTYIKFYRYKKASWSGLF